jgi:hypothetical protein
LTQFEHNEAIEEYKEFHPGVSATVILSNRTPMALQIISTGENSRSGIDIQKLDFKSSQIT